jgi:hypothetical protein
MRCELLRWNGVPKTNFEDGQQAEKYQYVDYNDLDQFHHRAIQSRNKFGPNLPSTGGGGTQLRQGPVLGAVRDARPGAGKGSAAIDRVANRFEGVARSQRQGRYKGLDARALRQKTSEVPATPAMKPTTVRNVAAGIGAAAIRWASGEVLRERHASLTGFRSWLKQNLSKRARLIPDADIPFLHRDIPPQLFQTSCPEALARGNP